MKKLLIHASSVLLVISGSVAGAADVGTLMKNCNGCHGDNGVSQWSDIPTIAGLSAFFHSEALFTYRDAARPCVETEYRQGDTGRPATDMCRIAEDLGDEEIEALAATYAKLPFVPAEQDFDAGLVAAGEAIHEQHCDRCHSDAGTNAEDEAGRLGGQWMGYLQSAFAEYAAGDRPQPKKMAEKMAPLSDDDVKALLHYYASRQ